MTCKYCGCTGLTSITIPNSVTAIGSTAFGDCTGLTSINIPNSVTTIGSDVFNGCTGLTSIDIPNSVTSIGYQAFYGCTGLTSIDIPNNVTSIGERAFYGCIGLANMTVVSGNNKYDSRNNCNAIIETSSNTLIAGCKNTNIPNSVTTIGYYAFSGCTSLTSIEIPNSVTSIGERPFYGCTGLKSLTVNNNRPPVADQNITSQDVYDNCTLYIPAGSENAYYVADGWKYFKTIKTIDTIEKVPQDVNGDGIVDTQDVLEIYKYIQEH